LFLFFRICRIFWFSLIAVSRLWIQEFTCFLAYQIFNLRLRFWFFFGSC
jgi:hypothetical protein